MWPNPRVPHELSSNRKKLSEEAFSNTSYYDSLITNYLKTNNTFPDSICLPSLFRL